MSGELIVRGEVIGQTESTFEGKVSRSVQILKANAKGGVELLKVKLGEGLDPARFTKGATVELAVDVNTFEGHVYYKATRDVLTKPESRGMDKPKPSNA